MKIDLAVMFKKTCILVLLLFFFCGCHEKRAVRDGSMEVININPYEAADYINLSEIADSVICIKLQPDSGDIIGRIRELIIRPKYIYAFDIAQQMIFVFDKTGKFVAKLNKRGQGPDEYLHIGPVFIDDNEEYIEIVNYISPKPSVLKYSNINFELMETHPFPDVNFNTCRRHNGFYYFAIQQLDNTVNGKKTNGGIIVYDDRNNGKVLFDKTIDTGHSSFSVNVESFTKNEKNELFVSLMYDNTFYRLERG